MLRLALQSRYFGDFQVLGKINLTLGAGERIAIMGASGIGKSTLLRILAGLDKNFDGDLEAPSTRSLMFQNPNLLLWRSVRENLAIFHDKATPRAIDRTLSETGLLNKADHYPNQLSLGQQRRLALARSFLGEADLVLLDEPFASLDASLRQDMLDLTKHYLERKNTGLVLVTHNLAEAEALEAKVLRLEGKPATSAI